MDGKNHSINAKNHPLNGKFDTRIYKEPCMQPTTLRL